jgi:hypothetical protein
VSRRSHSVAWAFFDQVHNGGLNSPGVLQHIFSLEKSGYKLAYPSCMQASNEERERGGLHRPIRNTLSLLCLSTSTSLSQPQARPLPPVHVAARTWHPFLPFTGRLNPFKRFPVSLIPPHHAFLKRLLHPPPQRVPPPAHASQTIRHLQTRSPPSRPHTPPRPGLLPSSPIPFPCLRRPFLPILLLSWLLDRKPLAPFPLFQLFLLAPRWLERAIVERRREEWGRKGCWRLRAGGKS